MDVLFFSRTYFLQKTPCGLDIVGAFFFPHTFVFFFYFFVCQLCLSFLGCLFNRKLKFQMITDFKCGGKKGKRQRYGDRNTWTGGILLCAVTEVYRRQRKPVVQNQKSECRLCTGGTWESFGKMGKQVRRKMVCYKTFN